MHELTLAASLLELAEEHAQRSGLVQVLRVHLTLGALAPVDEEALLFAFEVARRGTIAEKAELCLVRVAGRASCEGCGAMVDVQVPGSPCPRCGSASLRVVEGDELRLTALEGV